MAIHRIIEDRAATHGDLIAINDSGLSLSYRELNRRANCVARHLIAHGFRRGGVATLRLPRSLETAIVAQQETHQGAVTSIEKMIALKDLANAQAKDLEQARTSLKQMVEISSELKKQLENLESAH